jgi:hypothetical protein
VEAYIAVSLNAMRSSYLGRSDRPQRQDVCANADGMTNDIGLPARDTEQGCQPHATDDARAAGLARCETVRRAQSGLPCRSPIVRDKRRCVVCTAASEIGERQPANPTATGNSWTMISDTSIKQPAGWNPSLPGVICSTGSVVEAAGEGPADQRVKIGIGQNGRLRHARGRLEALQGVTCIVAKDPVDTARPVA